MKKLFSLLILMMLLVFPLTACNNEYKAYAGKYYEVNADDTLSTHYLELKADGKFTEIGASGLTLYSGVFTVNENKVTFGYDTVLGPRELVFTINDEKTEITSPSGTVYRKA